MVFGAGAGAVVGAAVVFEAGDVVGAGAGVGAAQPPIIKAPPSELREMLAQSDFVVIAAPLTAETKGMVDEQELRSMKPTAFLINVSRGEIVNQSMLIAALRQGWIAGAGLDAFAVEPLPVESELWGLPNVILSPHMSGFTERRNERLVELFCESLKRYLAGQKLLTLIDIERGY